MRRKTPFPSIISRSFLLISRRLELQKRVKEQRETPQVKGDPGAESFPGSKHSFFPMPGDRHPPSRTWASLIIIPFLGISMSHQLLLPDAFPLRDPFSETTAVRRATSS